MVDEASSIVEHTDNSRLLDASGSLQDWKEAIINSDNMS
jgi:hypothetical protein